jgi:hypothetical protein
MKAKLVKNLSLICLPLLLSCNGGSGDGKVTCADHKTGKWIIEGIHETEYWVSRTELHQVEYSVFMGQKSKEQMDLEWISDCEYILFNRKQIEGGPASQRTDTMLVTLSDITSNSYSRTVIKYHNQPADAVPVTQRMLKR